MGNHVVIFPVAKEAEARAYAAWTDVQYAAAYEPGGIWAYVRNDAFGQWVVPYLGPPWAYDVDPIEEPAGGPEMRADGELHDSAVWPSAEDDL